MVSEEAARRAVGAGRCQPDRTGGTLIRGLGAIIAVEVGGHAAGLDCVDLDTNGASSLAKATLTAFSAVFDEL